MNGTGCGDRLYHLLPALYRQRDAAQGEPLRALFAAMEEELCAIEDDIGALYDNWFIETCEEWVVAYLADLIGVRGLSDEKHLAFSQRARVANTLGYRRRKGTAATLQDTARDAAGWRVRAVEFFELLCATQHVQHLRPEKGATVDVRARAGLERAGSPFDTIARRVDVRRIATGRGWYNLSNIGIFVWRLQSYPLTHAAHAVASVPDGRYTFDPLGRDLQLFNRPQTRNVPARSATEAELPIPIGARAFAADLDAYQISHRSTPRQLHPVDSIFYGPGRSLAIVKDGEPVPPSTLTSADLGDWSRPNTGVAVDTQLGRIAFAFGEEPKSSLAVSYNYGFGADLGGGPYDRRNSLDDGGPNTWRAQVVSAGAAASVSSAHSTFATLTEAVEAWIGTGQPGLIEILDSETYDLSKIELPPHRALVIQAVDGVRPAISSTTLIVNGPDAVPGATLNTTLSINGLVFAGSIQINGDPKLKVLHCSVLGDVAGEGPHDELHVSITRSVVGSLPFPSEGVTIEATDSIINGQIAAAALTLHRVTVLGSVSVKEIGLASETIFAEPVAVERQQSGAMRFCFVAERSTTPPRFRCQPDLALSGADIGEQIRIRRRVAPSLVSRRYGDPSYAQLIVGCAPEITTGAEDGGEMGAFHHLHQPQRSANLSANLAEYLPLGLETGIVYVT